VKLETKIEEIINACKIPVFSSIHKPEDIISGDESVQKPISELKGKKVYAFCGIANPESFKKTLLAVGATIISLEIFPDHYSYGEKEIEKIKTGFLKSAADYLITTQKDAMRLKNKSDLLKMIFILRVNMEIKSSPQLFEKFIIDNVKLCCKK
jgi:tetraacyldisaccharide 4'-kinase